MSRSECTTRGREVGGWFPFESYFVHHIIDDSLHHEGAGPLEIQLGMLNDAPAWVVQPHFGADRVRRPFGPQVVALLHLEKRPLSNKN